MGSRVLGVRVWSLVIEKGKPYQLEAGEEEQQLPPAAAGGAIGAAKCRNK